MTERIEVLPTPTAVPLTSGKAWSVQFRAPLGMVAFLKAATTPPTLSNTEDRTASELAAFVLQPGHPPMTVKVQPGLQLYVWGELDPATSRTDVAQRVAARAAINPLSGWLVYEYAGA